MATQPRSRTQSSALFPQATLLEEPGFQGHTIMTPSKSHRLLASTDRHHYQLHRVRAHLTLAATSEETEARSLPGLHPRTRRAEVLPARCTGST